MTDRIITVKADEGIEIIIKAFIDDKKQKMLIIWIVLFTICGLAIFSQFFGNYDNGTKVFFGVYIAFWLFFEFKVIYAYRWRKYGLEKIIINKDELILIKEIKKRGITQTYPTGEISNVRLFSNQDSDFIKSMTNSYWNINKYALAFDFNNSIIPFAIDLENKDAKYILKEMKSYINERTLE